MISLVLIFTNLLHQTCYINSSREHSRIISSTGLENILSIHMVRHKRIRFSMILIDGKFTINFFWSLLYYYYRIAVAPPFSGLRHFPQGRGFKQWTGDDSKALMKVDL